MKKKKEVYKIPPLTEGKKNLLILVSMMFIFLSLFKIYIFSFFYYYPRKNNFLK